MLGISAMVDGVPVAPIIRLTLSSLMSFLAQMTACGSCPCASHAISRTFMPPMPPVSLTIATPTSAPSK